MPRLSPGTKVHHPWVAGVVGTVMDPDEDTLVGEYCVYFPWFGTINAPCEDWVQCNPFDITPPPMPFEPIPPKVRFVAAHVACQRCKNKGGAMIVDFATGAASHPGCRV